MKTVYGPYRSWRLGYALGVDPICRQPKVCNLKCVYCRLGCGGIMVTERGRFVDEDRVKEEAKEILDKEKVDVLEFRGTGEPFLAKNLHEIVRALRGLTDVPFGIVTNGTMLGRDDVRKELKDFDVIVVKLDAVDEDGFRRTNRPHHSITFERTLAAIRDTIAESKGDVIIQVMFYKGNVALADRISELVRDIGPSKVFLSTPQCPEIPGLSKKELTDLVELFSGMDVRTIYTECAKER
ncbi:MAG: molybdenum cofactor biosynthesis protein A [Methanomassiliicoccales archaeon PtaU1.Bin124]|nr:MAG: molybdenum cofactor biosynthesis protein A [Methanomassiliicoccales archaeon PtaU1.Bin124]